MKTTLLWGLVALAAGQDEQSVALRVKGCPTKAQPVLRVDGKAALPDDTPLRGTLRRLEERLATRDLSAVPTDAGRATIQVADRKAAFEFPADRQGRYLIVVEIPDRPEVSSPPPGKKAPVVKWTFELLAWTDEWFAQLGPKLLEIDRFGQEALALVEGYERASSSKEVWADRSPKLAKDADAMIRKAEESLAPHQFPAAFKEIRDTVRFLKGCASVAQFGEDGKFKGPYDYRTKKPMQTPHREDFSFGSLRKDLERASAIAGREFCLWMVYDVRRSGARRAAAADLLKRNAEHPGVAPFAKLLESATPEDLADLEAKIRGGEAR